jgi:hypothetical protein
MSLVHSARLNGHDPYAYLRDVLERLPTQPASRDRRVADPTNENMVAMWRWYGGPFASAGSMSSRQCSDPQTADLSLIKASR